MRLARNILAGTLLLVLCGCTGYRLGPSNGLRAGDKTLQIVPVTNRTLEPRLGDAATSALRKEIQRDGTFRLVTSGTADIVVTCELYRYDRNEVSFVPDDIVTARDYRVSLIARVNATETATGKTLLTREFTGNTLMRLGNDLPRVERQTLPLLAADLARQITAALADGTW
jgi:hypothetical protein